MKMSGTSNNGSGQTQVVVQPDAFCVSREALLVAELTAALAVCVYDDTQGVGGLLHLRYVATSNNNQPLDLTDNTLSSDLLLMDRFCKELRQLGARKHSWLVSIFSNIPDQVGMEGPAATVLDLVKAYFADARRAVESKEGRHTQGMIVRFHPREGRIWLNGTPGTAPSARLAAPVMAY